MDCLALCVEENLRESVMGSSCTDKFGITTNDNHRCGVTNLDGTRS